MNASKLLAIAPGGRDLGVAVFHDDELRYYAVKAISKRSASGVPAEAARIVRALIHEHRPFKLALAQPLILHQSAERVAHVIRAVKEVALDEGLALHVLSPKAVRQFICSSERATKKQTYERLCAIYPELVQYKDKLKVWDNYYEPMFNAVALGLTNVLTQKASGQTTKQMQIISAS